MTASRFDWASIDGKETEGTYEALGAQLTAHFSQEDLSGVDAIFSWGAIQVKSSMKGMLGHLSQSLRLASRLGEKFQFIPVAVGPAPSSEIALRKAIEEDGFFVSQEIPGYEEIIAKARKVVALIRH